MTETNVNRVTFTLPDGEVIELHGIERIVGLRTGDEVRLVQSGGADPSPPDWRDAVAAAAVEAVARERETLLAAVGAAYGVPPAAVECPAVPCPPLVTTTLDVVYDDEPGPPRTPETVDKPSPYYGIDTDGGRVLGCCHNPRTCISFPFADHRWVQTFRWSDILFAWVFSRYEPWAPTPPRADGAHEVGVMQRGGLHQAECTCGWFGGSWEYREAAEDQRTWHLANSEIDRALRGTE